MTTMEICLVVAHVSILISAVMLYRTSKVLSELINRTRIAPDSSDSFISVCLGDGDEGISTVKRESADTPSEAVKEGA